MLLAPRYAPVDTPVGAGFFAFTAEGVVFLDAPVTEDEFLREAERALGVLPVRREPPASYRRRVEDAVEAGDGSCVAWSALPAFQRRVLETTSSVARGTVVSYGELARRVGSPNGARAVGTALARNPIPLIIPCHRVVRSNGAVGEYGMGGEPVKRTLLAQEGAQLQREAGRGTTDSDSRSSRSERSSGFST